MCDNHQYAETNHDPSQPVLKPEAAGRLPTASSDSMVKLPRRQEYKPTALRWWFHGLLMIFLAMFLGLTEYSMQLIQTTSQEDRAARVQLWSRDIEDHDGHQQSMPKEDVTLCHHTTRVSSKAISSQTEPVPMSTGSFLALCDSILTLTASPNSASSDPANSPTPSQTEQLLPPRDHTGDVSFSLANTSSASSGPHQSISTVLEICGTTIRTVFPGTNQTLTTSTYQLTQTSLGHLHLGFTTSTLRTLRPDLEASDLVTETATESAGIFHPHAPADSGITMLSTTSASAFSRTTSTSFTKASMPTPTPSEIHGESVTVIRQTEAPFELTVTDSMGQVFVETIKKDIQSVLETTLTVRPGETVVAILKMITTTHEPITRVMQMTYTDSKDHSATYSYTTVIRNKDVIATRTDFVVTSLPPGYTVITIPTAVPVTEAGALEVLQTVYTDDQGRLMTSSYTRSSDGTPTSRVIPVVIATPLSPGDRLVALPTVSPTVIGGTTKIRKTTSTDSQGQPTTFLYTTVEGGTPMSTNVWAIVPTPTPTRPPNTNGTRGTGDIVSKTGVDLTDYVLGTFLPTILAAILAYPFKLININARLMQPFHELAIARQNDGVSAEASVFLRFYGWTGFLSLPRSVKLRQPIIVISDLLVFGAALLTPLAANTVSVQVSDGCTSGCYGSLGVAKVSGRVLEALIAAMMALLLLLIVLVNFFNWKTGVSHNPWSIAGMASLGLNPDIRNKIRQIQSDLGKSDKEKIILKVLADSKYALDVFSISSSAGFVSAREYGMVVWDKNNGGTHEPGDSDRSRHVRSCRSRHQEKRAQPFSLLTWWGRCGLLFIFACVLIIVVYYETTSLDSGFERFMDSRGFGVRFFFTALGVLIGACIESFFRSVATILPYQRLSKHALPAGQSILLSPPTNAFYGIYSAMRQRSLFFGAVAFTTILAELLLPVTLSHVPFSQLDTYETQFFCAWISITILALMILVILYSFFTQWPHMPVDPRTIAGAMFYFCDSWMLDTLDGMAKIGKNERDSSVRDQRLRYTFSRSEGVSGEERMNVDTCRYQRGEAAMIIRGEKARYG